MIAAKDVELFCGDELTDGAREAKAEIEDRIRKAKAAHTRKRRDQHSKTKTTVFGQDVEPLVTQIHGFRYDHRDCRYFNDPIDLVIFDGLHADGYVKNIVIGDIKTFEASLSRTQKQIRDRIGEHAVRYFSF